MTAEEAAREWLTDWGLGGFPDDERIAASLEKLLTQVRLGALGDAANVAEDYAAESYGASASAHKYAAETIADNIRALSPSPVKAATVSQWQDISTAPNDGTEIWAYAEEQARMKWIEGDGYALWVWADELLTEADPDPVQPTHWQPLPPSPQSSGTTPEPNPQQKETTMSDAQMELPRYRSHKEVHALKIKTLIYHDENQTRATITPEDERYAPFEVDGHYLEKHEPKAGGYYVVYADGYKSWSPAQAFEEGYTRVST